MIYKKILLILGLSVALPSFPESLHRPSSLDTLWNRVANSDAFSWYEKNIYRHWENFLISCYGLQNDGKASAQMKALSESAQTSIGVPQEKQVQVKLITTENEQLINVAAIAFSDGIYLLDESYFEKLSPGAKNHILLHEATHIKYHDNSMRFLLSNVPGALIGFQFFKALKAKKIGQKFPAMRGLASIMAGTIAAYVIENSIVKYAERRADIESCYALDCYVCLQQIAKGVKYSYEVQKIKERDNGYLWADEIEILAEDLKAHNRVCEQHKHEVNS